MDTQHQPDNSLVTLQIKNMVCPRCIRVVSEELSKLSVTVHNVRLGEAIVETNNVPEAAIEKVLLENGFELLNDKEDQIVEKIKSISIQLARQDSETESMVRNSDYIAQQLGMSYSSISKLFSRHENITLEKYIIFQKLEHVKELLQYNQYTLSEIAYKMGYRSVQHLSNQFKKYINLSVTDYKSKHLPRKPIDSIT